MQHKSLYVDRKETMGYRLESASVMMWKMVLDELYEWSEIHDKIIDASMTRQKFS